MKISLVILVLFITILGCSNSNNLKSKLNEEQRHTLDSIFQVEKFNPNKRYDEPLSLQYRGNPILTIGNELSSLDTNLSFHLDPNMKYEDYFSIIRDHLVFDDEYILKQTTGSLNGLIFFSSDLEKEKIFYFNGNWLLKIDSTDEAKKEAIETITTKLFPCLKGRINFDKKRKVSIDKKDFVEEFRIVKQESNDWSLFYDVKLK
jgi:hypothetical protein